MALAANTIWNSISTGNDANGGGFNPASANMVTDLVATSGNTSAPVVTSASCSFVAGDVGAWLFIQSGTNWIPGWYQIASVTTGAATLTATIGSAYLYENGTYGGLNTVAGCSTTASPTAGKYSIDFSTLTTAISLTSLASAAAGAVLNNATNSRVCHIGNIVNLTGGTNVTTGWYEIANCTAATSITTDRNCCTASVPANGAANVGGALATPGKAAGLMVGGNKLFAGGSQSITSASSNVSNGCVTLPGSVTGSMTKLIGYTSIRGDGGNLTMTASGISAFTMITGATSTNVQNVILNGASLTTSRGGSAGSYDNCKFSNFTNTGISQPIYAHRCEVTGCSTTSAVIGSGTGTDISFCNIHDNTFTGVQDVAHIYRCQIVKNTGATSHGVSDNNGLMNRMSFCTVAGNGANGVVSTASLTPCIVTDNVFYGNGVSAAGYGFSCSGGGDNYVLRNNAFGANTTGATLGIGSNNNTGSVTLTVDPFVSTASNNYTLNSTAGGGASCKAAALPATMPAGVTTESLDIGVSQSAALAPTGTVIPGRRRKMTRLSPAIKRKPRKILSMNVTNVNVIIKRRRKNIRLAPAIKKKARKVLNQVMTTVVIKRKRKTQRVISQVKKRRQSVPQPPIISIIRRRRRGVRAAVVICKKKHGKMPPLSVFTTINNIILKKRKKVFARSMTLTMKSKKSRRNGPIGSLNTVMINKRRRKSVRPLQVVVKKRKQKVPPQVFIMTAIIRKRRKIARYPAVFVRPRKISAAINAALFNVIVARRRRVL